MQTELDAETKQARLQIISEHLKISQTYAQKSANALRASVAEAFAEVSIRHSKKARELQGTLNQAQL